MLCCKWSLLCGALLAGAVVAFCRPCHDDLDLSSESAEQPIATQTIVHFERFPCEAREQLIEESLHEVRASTEGARFMPKECEQPDDTTIAERGGDWTGFEAYETETVLSPQTSPIDGRRGSHGAPFPLTKERQEAAADSGRPITR